MNLIKPSYTILTDINGEEILKSIELAARSCYKSEGDIKYTDMPSSDNDVDVPNTNKYYAKSARELITKLLNREHEAMLEFGGMITVRFICDRGVSHELVRHRICSYAMESTRYCDYSKDKFDKHVTFIIPPWMDIKQGTYIIEKDYEQFFDENTMDIHEWFMCLADAELTYLNLVDKEKYNWSAQQARSVLPNALKTEINMSANIRQWRLIFKLRTANAAHPQMRELMRPLLDEFKRKIPILFDDINY